MNRNLILLVVVLLLAAATTVVFWERLGGEDPNRAPGRGEAPFKIENVDTSRIAAITISSPDLGRSRLEKRGETWVLPEHADAPVLPERMTQFFDALADLDTAVVKATRKEVHKDFGVEEEKARRVVAEDASGNVLLDLFVGNQDSSGGRTRASAGSYIRAAGHDEVLSHSKKLMHLSYPTHSFWMDTRMTDLPPEVFNEKVSLARRVTLEYDDVPIGPQPGAGDEAVVNAEIPEHPERLRVVLEWSPPEEPEAPEVEVAPPVPAPPNPRDPSKQGLWSIVEPPSPGIQTYTPWVQNMVRQLFGVRFSDVVGRDLENPAYGLDPAVLDVTVEFEDGSTHNLRVGAICPGEEEEGVNTRYRYARAAGLPFVVTIRDDAAAWWKKAPKDLQLPEDGARPNPVGPKPIPIPEGGEEPPDGGERDG